MASVSNIEITAILWRDKSIGIAERKLSDKNYINVTVKDKNGRRFYERPFLMTREEIMSYPLAINEKYGTRLRQIPLAEAVKYEVSEEKRDTRQDIVY